jgi:hypothetical protein
VLSRYAYGRSGDGSRVALLCPRAGSWPDHEHSGCRGLLCGRASVHNTLLYIYVTIYYIYIEVKSAIVRTTKPTV